MTKHFDLIAFDADDTLWHNEILFIAAREKLEAILATYGIHQGVEEILFKYETRSLEHFGFGVNGFTFSMLETAVEMTSGSLRGEDVLNIINIARWMLENPVELFEGVVDTISRLSKTHRLIIITKGEMLNQQNKVNRSGIAGYFQKIEIVNSKAMEDYATILEQAGVEPSRFLMVGNSLKSDILPALSLGGWAVYIPFIHTWAHEIETAPEPGRPRFTELKHISLLPEFIQQIESGISRTDLP